MFNLQQVVNNKSLAKAVHNDLKTHSSKKNYDQRHYKKDHKMIEHAKF